MQAAAYTASEPRTQGAPAVGASLLSVIMRRGYNRAFPLLVRIAVGNYWRWDYSLQREKQIKIDALRAKKKAETRKHGFSAYQSTPLLSQRTLKNFVRKHCNFRGVKVPV